MSSEEDPKLQGKIVSNSKNPSQTQAQAGSAGGGFLPIICYPFQLARSFSSSDSSQEPSAVKKVASSGGRGTPLPSASVDDALAQLRLSRSPSFQRQISSASKSKSKHDRVPSSGAGARARTPTYQERAPAPSVASYQYHEDSGPQYQHHHSYSRSIQGDNDNGQFNRSRSRSPARSQMGSIYEEDAWQFPQPQQMGFLKNKNKNKWLIAVCGVLVAGAMIYLSTNLITNQVDKRMGVTLSAPSDADGDGISDGIEFEIGMNPYNADSNFYGISDGDEVVATMAMAASLVDSQSHRHSSKSSKSYLSYGCGSSGSTSGKSGKSSKCAPFSIDLTLTPTPEPTPAPTPRPTPAPTQAPTSLFPPSATGYYVEDPTSPCYIEQYTPMIENNEYAGCSHYWHFNDGDRRSTSSICEDNPYNNYGNGPEDRYCLSIEVRPGCFSFEDYDGGAPILFATSIAWDWSAFLAPNNSPDTSTCAAILTDPVIYLRNADESVGGAPGFGTGLPGTTGQCYDRNGFPINPGVNQATSTVAIHVQGTNYLCNVIPGGKVCKMWGFGDDGQPSNYNSQHIPFRCPDIDGDVYEGHVNISARHFSLTPVTDGAGNLPRVVLNKVT